MKLLLKQYLNSLRERSELDALLPDLLTEMGLRVYSRPSIGTRQFGVDIGAVGSIGGQVESVYLFSIKAGDLNRAEWDASGLQALRPSLNEIRDAYIGSHIPPEHKGKRIVIVLCFGGSIREEVRQQVAMYQSTNTTRDIVYEEWDGDRLAQLIEQHLLSENLVPVRVRADLRKAIALIEEPDASFRHFLSIARQISSSEHKGRKEIATALRQLAVCSWVLYVWARESGNLEAPCRASEIALLHGWHIAKVALSGPKPSEQVADALNFLLSAYLRVHGEYVGKIAQAANVYFGLSMAVKSSVPADVNMSMFKMIGRVALYGLWMHLFFRVSPETERKAATWNAICNLIKAIIANNPTLKTPLQDDHVVDIGLVLLLMSLADAHEPFIRSYIDDLTHSSLLAMVANGPYPCVFRDYQLLIRHPESRDSEYVKRSTESSVLYPTLATWAALVGPREVYDEIKTAKANQLTHCSFQIWSPSKDSEEHLYLNDALHGISFLDLELGSEPEELLKNIWSECDSENSYDELSCVKTSYYPILLTACRHYRLPVPWHLTRGYREQRLNPKPSEASSASGPPNGA